MTLWLSIAIVVVLSLPALLFIRPFGPSPSPSAELLRATTLGMVIILASLYPYWLFGPASAIGWYDEYDGIIQFYLTAAAAPSLATFAHGYAGGSGIGDVFPDIGNAVYDLYFLLIRSIGPELASFVYRLLGSLILYLGIFVSAQTLVKASFAAAVTAGLVAVFCTVYPYGWVLGGYGWDLSLMVWLPVLFLSRLGWIWRVILAAVLAAIIAGTTTIVFFVPFAIFYTFLAVYFVEGRVWPTLVRSAASVAVLALVAGLLTLNTTLTLVASLKESGRYQAITGPRALAAAFSGGPVPSLDLLSVFGEGMNGIFLRGLNVLIGRPLSGFPPTVIFTILAIAAVIWLARSQHGARYLICLFGPVALVGGLTFLGGTVEIPFISAFRWDTLYVCIAVLFALVFAVFQANATNRAARLACLVAGPALLLSVVISAGSMAQRSIVELDAYGGWATLSAYPQLAGLAQADPLARAASLPAYQPKPLLGPHYGLDVVDGMRGNFTWRRTGFWFETLPTTPNSAWHTHRQVLGRGLGDINLDALRMIGGQYLMSPTVLDGPGLSVTAQLPGLRLADLGGPYSLLRKVFPKLSLAPTLSVYRLGGAWDRAFSPADLKATTVSDFDLEYFTQLRSLPRHTILIPTNAPDWLKNDDPGHLTIEAATKTASGMEIRTGGEGGLLVYNQEPVAGWRATCENTALSITPINAMMMAVQVPAGCFEVRFIHGS